MTRFLGFPLKDALDICTREGIACELKEVSSRKGCDGNDCRIISENWSDELHVKLTFSRFITEIQK